MKLTGAVIRKFGRFVETLSPQAQEQQRLRIVGISSHDAIAISDKHAVAFSVVGDALHKDVANYAATWSVSF